MSKQKENYAMEMVAKMVALRVLIVLLGALVTVCIFGIYYFVCQGRDIVKVMGYLMIFTPLFMLPIFIAWEIGKHVWFKQKDMLRAKLHTMR